MWHILSYTLQGVSTVPAQRILKELPVPEQTTAHMTCEDAGTFTLQLTPEVDMEVDVFDHYLEKWMRHPDVYSVDSDMEEEEYHTQEEIEQGEIFSKGMADFAEFNAPPPAEPVQRISQKTARNAPCPCGSGKKYKKCHGGE